MAVSSTRVLVVDHDPLCRWALNEALAGAGFDVSSATADDVSHGPDGVDVLVLDTALPAGGAMTVLDRVRGRSPRCRVVLMTTSDSRCQRRALLPTSNRWRSLEKPFDLERIVTLVAELRASEPA